MARRFNNPQNRRGIRRRIEAVLALDAAGIARVLAADSRCVVKVLFSFNADSRRDVANAEAAALFVNARRCHPDRAARMLRQFARPEGRSKPAPARKRKRKAKPAEGVSLRRNGQPRNAKQLAKLAEMRARYLRNAG
jgi:hypothetical protein